MVKNALRSATVEAFDAENPPEVSETKDGVCIWFEIFPPGDVMSWDGYEDFDKQLSKAIGVPVEWPDKEVMGTSRKKADTFDRVVDFLSNFRANLKAKTKPKNTKSKTKKSKRKSKRGGS